MKIALIAALVVAAAPLAAQTAPLQKSDLKAPENAARAQLIQSLDELAAKQTAARRAVIASIHTRQQAIQRQAEVRRKMLSLIGQLPEKTPLNPKITGTVPLDGFHIEKLTYESQPGFHVTALLYLPDGAKGKLPAIVIAPGHGPTGKASDYAFASTFARNGFAVLSYDPIGQGERLQYPDPADPSKSLATRPTGEHAEASLQPTLIGETLAKYMLWDGMRAVDYLLTRPEIDPTRIGAFGCSGGGAMTALLGGLDPRIAATGVACYTTSYDTLLASIGPQDGEQSVPGWIAAGLDFPDWIEVAAPRPYAAIATSSDMFPWAGAVTTVREARRFYALFDPASAGTHSKDYSSRKAADGSAVAIPTITGPTLNPDATATIPPSAKLQFITGIGGHGNLPPLQSQIISFFLAQLAHSDAAPILPPPPAPGASPFALPAGVPKDAFQVTATGQVATAFPGAATVFSLNLDHAGTLPEPPSQSLHQLQSAIYTVLGVPPAPALDSGGIRQFLLPPSNANMLLTPKTFSPSPPNPANARVGALLILTSETIAPPQGAFSETQNRFYDAPEHGRVSLLLGSRPNPAGKEEQKTPLLGFYYMLGLRAELTGNTLLGLRVEDVLQAIDALTASPEVDPANITAEASGHEALVLLHAAILDPRLKHITLTHLPPSYREMLANPLPKDIAEDLIPGVLLHYDTPDLIKALGSRVTVVPDQR